MNLFDPRYQDEDAAREHLEALHWPNGPFCPHCGSFDAKRLPPQLGRKTKAHPDGTIRKGQKIRFMVSGAAREVEQVGFFTPNKVPLNELQAGEMGYITAGSNTP